MKIHRVHICFIERITNFEYLVNCRVIYQPDKYKISKEAVIQFRVPEITDDIVIQCIETTLEKLEKELDFVREFNERH